MGREVVRFEVSATVSRHNSEQDRIDDLRWEELKNKVRDLFDEYQDLRCLDMN